MARTWVYFRMSPSFSSNDSIGASGEPPPSAGREVACARSFGRCSSGICRHLLLHTVHSDGLGGAGGAGEEGDV